MKPEEKINEEIEQNEVTDTQNEKAEETAAAEEKVQAELTDAEKLAEAEQKLAELQDKYLRQVAEFDNYRKRTIKEKADLILNGAEKTITAILPVLDDMERALKNMETAEDVAAVKEGVDLIMQKFIKILENQGGKKIETEIPAPADEMKGKVIDCVQTGYTLNDKVIRHSKVAVGL